jgi:hypothetical protein
MSLRKGLRAACIEEALPAWFAHLQALSIRQDDPAFVLSFTKDLAHVIDVHDCGAMDADELLWIKSICKLLDRLAEHEGLWANV